MINSHLTIHKLIIVLTSLYISSTLNCSFATKLQGEVQSSGAPEFSTGKMGQEQPLSGQEQDNGLSGQANDNGPLQGNTSQDGNFKGNADQAIPDPDAADKEIMIAWDRWRNRLLHAIQDGMDNILNNPNNMSLRWDPMRQAMVNANLFPLGTVAWFSCQITPDQRMIHIKLLHSSGYPAYDRAVLEAIDGLQGSNILRYPPGSKRTIVTQAGGIQTATSSNYQNFHFGDIEKQMMGQ